MAKVLVASLPGVGHVNGSLAIAKVLQQRGHSITYIGTADAEAIVRKEGMPFDPFLKKWFPPRDLSAATLSDKAKALLDKLTHIRGFFDAIKKGAFHEFLRAERPALFIVDADLPFLAVVAVELGIPTVAFNTTLSPTRSAGLPPLTSDLIPDGTGATARRIERAWRRAELQARVKDAASEWVGLPTVRGLVRQLATAGGVPLQRIDFNTTIFPPRLDVPELTLCQQAFDFPHELRPNERFVGAWVDFGRRGPEFDWSRIPNDQKLVYCSLGSMGHKFKHRVRFFRTVVEAVRSLPHVFLVLSTPGLGPEALGPLPANVLQVDWAPQIAVLTKADLMITHGGLNSIKECVSLKVPMIVFPLRWDQPGNAARVVHHGIGVRGDARRVTARDLTAMIDRVLTDGSFRERVRVLGEAAPSERELAVSFIEGLLPAVPTVSAAG